MVRTLDINENRCNSPERRFAIQGEVDGLSKRETFEIILKEDVSRDANVLPGCFVLFIKSKKDNREVCKARFVIEGHRDRFKKKRWCTPRRLSSHLLSG